VKERVELYLCFPFGPSWPVLGRTLPLCIDFKIFSYFVLTLLRGVSSMDSVRYPSSVDSLYLIHKIKIYVNVITEHLVFREGTLLDLYFIRTVM
jgi:hypothetical protein